MQTRDGVGMLIDRGLGETAGCPGSLACALSQVLELILTYWVVMLLRVILTMALFILDNISWIWLKVVIHLLLPHIATTTTTTTTETRYFSS